MAIGISIREFARREGCSHTLVNRAIKQNRIKQLEDGSLDPALVGTAWRESNLLGGNKGGNTNGNTPAGVSTPAPAKKAAPTPPRLPSSAASDDESLAAEALNILAASGAVLDYAEALRVKENYLAMLRQLEFEQKSGALIELTAAQSILFEAFRAQRDAWLNWPVRIGPVLAAELGIEEADRVTEALTAHVHKQLSDLGEPDVNFADTKK